MYPASRTKAGCPSGQWERTVNPSAYAYAGSNPAPATTAQTWYLATLALEIARAKGSRPSVIPALGAITRPDGVCYHDAATERDHILRMTSRGSPLFELGPFHRAGFAVFAAAAKRAPAFDECPVVTQDLVVDGDAGLIGAEVDVDRWIGDRRRIKGAAS